MKIFNMDNLGTIPILKRSALSALLFIFAHAACKSSQIPMAESIILAVKDEKTVQGLSITYLSYSHEHSSSGPDEPFEATTGVYFLLLDTGETSENVTLYHGINSKETTLDWEGYRVTLYLVENGQETIHLRVEKGG